MINLLPQDIDSVPFFLEKEVLASVDSISENQFMPSDSSSIFFEVDPLNQEVIYSGLEGLARSFMQQQASLLFLVFTLLFILSSIIFKTSGRGVFSNFRHMFSAGSRNNNSYSQQVTTIDVWSTLFFIFQTIVIYSILFFDLTLRHTTHFIDPSQYLLLFSAIFGVIFIFVFSTYVVYKIWGAVFTNTKTNVLIDIYLWIVYITGILSFIPIVAYFYIPEVRMYVLLFLGVIFIVGRILVFIKAYSFFDKSHIGILYFFVYLCGVEILPYFLLYKAIISIN